MPRISDFSILTLVEQPILTTRRRVAVSDLPAVISGGFAQLAAHCAAVGGELTDIPFVSFEGDNPTDVGVAVAFPLAAPTPGGEEIAAELLPGGKAAMCMYLGPYDAIAPVYDEMRTWVTERGYTVHGGSREYYYNGPEYGQERLLTRVVMALVKT